MAITVTDRGTHQTTIGSTTGNKTSTSFTPAAGSYLVVGIFITWTKGGSPSGDSVMTVSDSQSGSWTQRAVCTRGAVSGGVFREDCYLYTAATVSSTSMTVSVSEASDPWTGSFGGWLVFHIWEVSGQAASPIGRAASPSPVTTGTTFNTDLGGVPASDSAVFGVMVDDGETAANIVQPTGWTESDEQADTGSVFGGTGGEFAFINGGSVQSPQWTGMANGDRLLGCAVEIKAAPVTVTQIVADPLKTNPPGKISPVGRTTALGDPNVRGQAVYPDQTVTATGTANSPTATVSPVPAQATGAATANLPGFTIAPNGLGVATGNATGQSPTSILAPNAGSASSTATANQPSGFTVSFTAPVATATTTAQTPTPTVLVNAGIATATATANDPTVQTSGGNFTNAQPAAATATATANNATNTVAPTLSAAATATATANQPVINTTGHTNAPAGVGTATATANLPGFTVIVNAGVAQATATANAPTGQLGPSPANAQAVAAAYITSAAVLVAGAVVATAQATANNATGFSGIVGTPKTEPIVYRRPAIIKYRPR